MCFPFRTTQNMATSHVVLSYMVLVWRDHEITAHQIANYMQKHRRLSWNYMKSILFKVLRDKTTLLKKILRLKREYWENDRYPGTPLILLGLHWNVNLENVSAVLIQMKKKSHFDNDDFDLPIVGGLNCFSKKACGDKYVVEISRCLKDCMFNHILNIHRNKNGTLSQHFNNADDICFGAVENVILYPMKQIPDQDNAQRNKSLRHKRKPRSIKKLGTHFFPWNEW